MTPLKVLILSGMKRPSAVVGAAQRILTLALESAEASVSRQSMFEHKLELFDGDDIDAGVTRPVARSLADLILAHDAILMMAPEYHGGIAPVVKNWFDWAQAACPIPLLAKRVVGLVATCPDRHLGILGLNQMAGLCHTLGGTVMPGSMGIWDHPDALNETGDLKDRGGAARLRQLAQDLVLSATHARI